MTEEQRIVAEVLSQELRLLDPAMRANSAQVARLLHPDFEEFGASGQTWDRDSMVAALASDPGEAAVTSDMSACLVADDVVLVTYRSGCGSEERGGSLRSSLWCRGEDGWRIRFHQGTPVDSGGRS